MNGKVVWFEVLGQDADKLQAFYGELLGWKFKMEGPEGYGMLPPDVGGQGGGVGKAPAGGGWTTFYVEVDDLEASVARAEKLGGRVLMPITDISDGRIAVISDPEGHPVGLSKQNAA